MTSTFLTTSTLEESTHFLRHVSHESDVPEEAEIHTMFGLLTAEQVSYNNTRKHILDFSYFQLAAQVLI